MQEFSVVIPTYNRGSLAERAVRSALAQSYPPAEIIVVDDGSQDDTGERISGIEGPVNYVYQDNAGSAVARNTGLKTARYPWVALLDSDDVWHAQHLERMAGALEATKGAANYYFADTLEPVEKGSGMLWEKLSFDIVGDFELAEDGSDWVMMRPRQPMMLQSTIVNRDAALRIGGFKSELRYRDDTHLFMKLGLGQPICAVNGCGAIMTSDDDPDNRLTLTHDRTIYGTRMRTIMLADLLDGTTPMSAKTRARLQRWQGTAHRTLARHAWRNGRYVDSMRELYRSFKSDPRLASRRIRSRVSSST